MHASSAIVDGPELTCPIMSPLKVSLLELHDHHTYVVQKA